MDLSFLESCFKAGALDSWFAVSVHPYLRQNPENVAGEYAKLRKLIASYRAASGREEVNQPAANISIISGEWGYSSAWHGMTEEKQAIMLARQFLTNAANGIPLSIWYHWRDDGLDPKEAEHHFGLVRNEYRSGQTLVYQPKPAYLAARTLLGHFAGYRFEQRLAVGSGEDYVLVFKKDNERRIAAWTTSSTVHSLVIPSMNGQFTIIGTNGEDRGRLSSNQGGLSINLTAAPVYLASAPAPR
jgi:hypothetical protein